MTSFASKQGIHAVFQLLDAKATWLTSEIQQHFQDLDALDTVTYSLG